MSFRDKTAYWRRALWHARQGGMGQVKSYLHRSTVERDEASLAGVRGSEGAWRGLGRGRHLIFREAAVDVAEPRNPQLRVGIIMDDFSAAAFSAEWSVVALRPDSWEQQLHDEALSFVVVESAWAGNAGLWRGKITGPAGPSAVFLELVDGCRAAGLPAIFWNKEDPPHYEDFLPAAKLFDHVFTTDANMLPRYRADLGHDRISVLPFAAQPRIHNPARPRHGWHARRSPSPECILRISTRTVGGRWSTCWERPLTRLRANARALRSFRGSWAGSRSISFPEFSRSMLWARCPISRC